MITVEEAQAILLRDLRPLAGQEIALDRACGHTLAAPVLAQQDHPLFDNSAMDGFAVRCQDLHTAGPGQPHTLRRVGAIYAGDGATPPPSKLGASRHRKSTSALGDHLQSGEAARIFTGAPVPAGADAVVMQERTRYDDAAVTFFAVPQVGQNIRYRAEDLREGDPLLPKGHLLTPGDVAVLANQAVRSVTVTRQPKVAIVPTGNELVTLTSKRKLKSGQIIDSNSPMLAAMIRSLGAAPVLHPPVKDTPEHTRAALMGAAETADLVVTCGGVSVGDHDLVRNMIQNDHAPGFAGVAMKPGKPVCYATLQNRPLIGLPGNPVSAYVCAVLFVLPAIRRLLGQGKPLPPLHAVQLATDVRPHPKRVTYLRAQLQQKNGLWWAAPAATQGSASLRSLLNLHTLLRIPSGQEVHAAGTPAQALVLRWPYSHGH